MSGALCLVDVGDGKFAFSPDELRAAAEPLAQALGGPIAIGLIGPDSAELAEGLRGEFDQVLVTAPDTLRTYTAGESAAVATAFVEAAHPTACVAAHTHRVREWLPLVAFRLGAGLVTDCVALALDEGALLASRPVFGGAAIAEFAIRTTLAFATVRAKAFDPSAVPAPQRQGDLVEVFVRSDHLNRETVLEEVRSTFSDGVRLQDARVVVSGGRGIGSPDDWHFIEETAAALGGAVGCSRPLVDSGWLSPALQVGLTGTAVSPDLYLAVGISGALQHLSGISGADCVVAINTDAEAPIFKIARYGVVGSFRDVLPAFVARARELSTIE